MSVKERVKWCAHAHIFYALKRRLGLARKGHVIQSGREPARMRGEEWRIQGVSSSFSAMAPHVVSGCVTCDFDSFWQCDNLSFETIISGHVKHFRIFNHGRILADCNLNSERDLLIPR